MKIFCKNFGEMLWAFRSFFVLCPRTEIFSWAGNTTQRSTPDVDAAWPPSLVEIIAWRFPVLLSNISFTRSHQAKSHIDLKIYNLKNLWITVDDGQRICLRRNFLGHHSEYRLRGECDLLTLQVSWCQS